MPDRHYLLAEQAAYTILQRFREEHPLWTGPRTPIDAVARWLGLEVETFHPDDYPRGTYGFIDPDEDERLIWLCRDLHETLRRFTLAHEIGHVLLHCRGGERIHDLLQDLYAQFPQEALEPSRADPCHNTDVQEEMTALIDQEQFEESLGIGHSYDPRGQREIAANVFAATLLMPIDHVRALYLHDGIRAETLAERFGVSQPAMLNRLAGLLKDSFTGGMLAVATDRERAGPADEVGGNGHASVVRPSYDEFQQAAIIAHTPALIVAGPGSGKTSTLIGRVEYLVDTLDVRPQNILALTFSRKAAQEMEQRVASVLPDAALPRMSTFHAFCADLLRQHATLVGLRPDFALIDEAESYFLLRQLSHRLHLRHYQNIYTPGYYFPAILKAIARAKDELVSPERYEQLAQGMLAQARDEEGQARAERVLEIAIVYKLYEEALLRRGDTDYGGLLVLAIRLLDEQPEVARELRQRYQHILVDEFQDINRASGVLLRALAGEERRVWVVGDANQAIYGFRGASPANIGQFKDDYPGAQVLPLSLNYRSRPDLVTLAESFRCSFLEPEQERGKNRAIRSAEDNPDVTIATAVDEAGELAGIAADMRSRLASGYDYRDMVVLCRTRAQVQKVSRALAKAGLPVTERGGLLEQEPIKDALAMVLLLADSSGMGLLRAGRQPAHPFSQRDLEALLLAAQEQGSKPMDMLVAGDLPLSCTEQGRASLSRLMEIRGTLLQRCADLWSVLARYLLIETDCIRALLSANDQDSLALRSAYDLLLQFAHRYDQHYRVRLEQQEREQREAEGQKEWETGLQGGAGQRQGGAVSEAGKRLREEGETGQEGEAWQPEGLPLSPSPKTLQERAREFLEYLSMLVVMRQDSGNRQQEGGADGQEVADVIRVMTVHASKGLEFPVVYLPGLVQRRFPSQRRANLTPPPAGMLPAESDGEAAHESGEACLFYVGVTRARDQLILSYSERYGKMGYKRSPYLDALEAGLDERHITQVRWDAGTLDDRAETMSRSHEQEIVPIGSKGSHGHAQSSQPGAAFIAVMKPDTLTISSIETYLHCPRQYAYQHIYHFQGELGPYQRFWQATQRTLEQLHQLREQQHTADPAEASEPLITQQAMRELYIRYWQELGGRDVPFAALYEQRGQEIVELLYRELVSRGEARWDMRQSYAVDIAGKTVHVPVDRVEASSHSAPVRFVRARYGKRKEKPTAELREMLYARAYRQAHPGQSVELHSHNLSTGEIQPITLTPRKEQSLYDELTQALSGIERDDYPALPAEPSLCPSCPFFFICPA